MQAVSFHGLPTISSLVAGVAVLCACTVQKYDPPAPDVGETPAASDSFQATSELLPTEHLPNPTPTSEEVLTIHGWLSIIWNDEAHYFITDDDGNTVELLLDEALTKPLGGPIALDRTRVTVVAAISSETPTILQALSIAREMEQ